MPETRVKVSKGSRTTDQQEMMSADDAKLFPKSMDWLI
jgi:hypothetical protein